MFDFSLFLFVMIINFQLELERTINVLKEKDTELDKAIAEIGEQGEVDVDEAVTTTTPLYKQ